MFYLQLQWAVKLICSVFFFLLSDDFGTGTRSVVRMSVLLSTQLVDFATKMVSGLCLLHIIPLSKTFLLFKVSKTSLFCFEIFLLWVFKKTQIFLTLAQKGLMKA